jgi:hypothetical protein
MVLQFIKRFNDDKWLTGNCYYFAIILKERFNGIIYYDVINSHFITLIDNIFYDFNGITIPDKPIKWDSFKEYDYIQYNRILKEIIE